MFIMYIGLPDLPYWHSGPRDLSVSLETTPLPEDPEGSSPPAPPPMDPRIPQTSVCHSGDTATKYGATLNGRHKLPTGISLHTSQGSSLSLTTSPPSGGSTQVTLASSVLKLKALGLKHFPQLILIPSCLTDVLDLLRLHKVPTE